MAAETEDGDQKPNSMSRSRSKSRSRSPSPSRPQPQSQQQLQPQSRNLHRSLSRSRSRSRSRSPSRSRTRARSRSRTRSRSPAASRRQRDGDSRKKHDLTLPVCRDFTRGRCSRSPLECRYAHPPPSVTIDVNEVTVCYDSLRDRCSRGYVCRYFHPPPHLRGKMQETIGLQMVRSRPPYHGEPVLPSDGFYAPAPHVFSSPLPVTNIHPPKGSTRPTLETCRDYIRGRCSRRADECRYAHHHPNNGDGDYVIVCQDYLRGKCQRTSCRYFHAPNHLKSQIKDRSVGSHPPNNDYTRHNAITEGNYGYAGSIQPPKPLRVELRVDEYPPPCHVYGHAQRPPLYQPAPMPVPPVPPMLSPPPARASKGHADEDKLPVCRDFHLRGNCSRGKSCRFVHPESHVQVVDNNATVCRDSVRGHCNRERCRFYHPPEKHSKNGTGKTSPRSSGNPDPLSPDK